MYECASNYSFCWNYIMLIKCTVWCSAHIPKRKFTNNLHCRTHTELTWLQSLHIYGSVIVLNSLNGCLRLICLVLETAAPCDIFVRSAVYKSYLLTYTTLMTQYKITESQVLLVKLHFLPCIYSSDFSIQWFILSYYIIGIFTNCMFCIRFQLSSIFRFHSVEWK